MLTRGRYRAARAAKNKQMWGDFLEPFQDAFDKTNKQTKNKTNKQKTNKCGKIFWSHFKMLFTGVCKDQRAENWKGEILFATKTNRK